VPGGRGEERKKTLPKPFPSKKRKEKAPGPLLDRARKKGKKRFRRRSISGGGKKKRKNHHPCRGTIGEEKNIKTNHPLQPRAGEGGKGKRGKKTQKSSDSGGGRRAARKEGKEKEGQPWSATELQKKKRNKVLCRPGCEGGKGYTGTNRLMTKKGSPSSLLQMNSKKGAFPREFSSWLLDSRKGGRKKKKKGKGAFAGNGKRTKGGIGSGCHATFIGN